MRAHKNRPTKEQVVAAIEAAESINQVGKNLGFNPGGSLYYRVHSLAKHYGLELPKWDNSESGRRATAHNTYSDEEWFSVGQHRAGPSSRKRLVASGRDYRCVGEGCLIPEINPMWNGKPITLHVDHIDGDKLNNLKENLRFLCANCHQQTETWGNKKRK